jgi:5-methylcytosine-specific restriction endonuclease McrA
VAQRTCERDDCDRPHRARGLCSKHWKAAHGKPTRYARTCDVCTRAFESSRTTGRFCSEGCKAKAYAIERIRRCLLPPDHPVMKLIALDVAAQRAAARKPVPRPPKRHSARRCPGCACSFTPLSPSAGHMLCCSPRCRRRVAKRRRRALEHNTLNGWTWSDFMRIARKFNYSCAYCGVRPRRLDPDHVVPLSRGGADAVANLLPACPACNSDKNDRTLEEWAARRQRQGKPPRTTTWSSSDSRFTHLTSVASVSAA